MTTLAVSKDQRRYPRYRVMKDAKLIFTNKRGFMDVMLKELSVGGARVQLMNSTDLAGTLNLWVPSEKLLYSVAVRWKKDDDVGLEFVAEAEYVPVLFSR